MFNSKKGLHIIGEIKITSPLSGILGREHEIESRAVQYEKAGIDYISVITEKTLFGGNISFIPRIKKVTPLPILQKDFITQEKQIYESKKYGANLLLLIAGIVDIPKLKQFVTLCQKLRIEPIVEIYDDADLQKAQATSTTCIATNARNLKTFEIDVDQACKLMKKIPNTYKKLGFSGIHSSCEVNKYVRAGASGVLIGTALMKAPNIHDFVQELRNI